MALLQILLVSISLSAPAQDTSAQRADCREWHECRQLALDALARGEYERFHDFAWRTVQTGPPKDPALMFLLARAQTLSGRPHDALVMLGRLAEMGVATDAVTNDEFRSVRTLREWPELEERLRALTSPSASPLAPAPERPSETAAVAPPAGPTSTYRAEDALRLPGITFSPRGLAYDAVSGRFVVADRTARKLMVLDERSRHVIDLVRASSAGFSDIGAFEIDPHRGDLWVASADSPADGAGSAPVAAVHKLQLVSGRPLETFPLPERFAPARFEDVAVTAAGTLFLLDAEGARIFSFQPTTRSFALVSTLTDTGVTSIAPVDDRTIYVAHASGITHIDTVTGTAAPLHSSADIDLSRFGRIRWSQGGLVGLQQYASGFRAVTIRVAGGRAVAAKAVDDTVPISDPTAVALAGNDLYVLARGADHELVVQRIKLR